MILKITPADRKRSPILTKGKKYKLVSKSTGRVLGYGRTKTQMKEREKQVQTFKHK